MEPISGDALRGHLETMALAALEKGEAHGFEVLRRLTEAGCGALRLREGSLYPALYRMEKAGLVGSTWEENPGDLQASVSWQDRVDARLDRWFGWRPGEPPARYLFRIASLGWLILLVWFVPALVVTALKGPADPTVPTAGMLLRCWAATAVFGTV